MNRFSWIKCGLLVWLPMAAGLCNAVLPAKTIGVSQIVEHPALDAVRQGMLDSLKEEGYVVGDNLTVVYENAQGNMVTATQIATKLLSSPLNLIVGISTPSAQTIFYTAKRMDKRIPIVFTAVSDPSAAKLEPGESHYPITGVTDAPDVKAVLTLMQTMLPRFKTIGFIYNSSEPNSVSTINQFKALLKDSNITVREAMVNKTADVAQAMHSLVGKVDALYFPQDNTVVSAIESVINIAESPNRRSAALPLFCSDPLLVKRGVLAAVGYDYVEVGLESGLVVAKLLKGEDVKDIPVHHPPRLKTIVNFPLARRLGLTIPKEATPS